MTMPPAIPKNSTNNWLALAAWITGTAVLIGLADRAHLGMAAWTGIILVSVLGHPLLYLGLIQALMLLVYLHRHHMLPAGWVDTAGPATAAVALATVATLLHPMFQADHSAARRLRAAAMPWLTHLKVVAVLSLAASVVSVYYFQYKPASHFQIANGFFAVALLRLCLLRNPHAHPLRPLSHFLFPAAAGALLAFAMLHLYLQLVPWDAKPLTGDNLLRPYPRARIAANPHGTDESGLVVLNRLGVRGSEPCAKVGGVFRVLCIGDSFTMGFRVEEKHAYPQALEKMLRAKLGDHRIEVINMACPGHGPAQEAIVFRDLGLSLQPDLVIHQLYLGNDLADELGMRNLLPEAFNPTYYEFQMQQGIREPFPWEFQLSQRSHAFAFVSHSLREWTVRNLRQKFWPHAAETTNPELRPMWAEAALVETPPKIEAAWAMLAESLQLMERHCKDAGADYRVLCMPLAFEASVAKRLDLGSEMGLPEEVAYDFTKPEARLQEVLERLGIKGYFCRHAMLAKAAASTEPLHLPQDPHLNPRGYHTVATLVAEHLLRNPPEKLAAFLAATPPTNVAAGR